MARKTVSTSTSGHKVPLTIHKCTVCLSETKMADMISAMKIPSGMPSVTYDCRGCGTPYTITYSVP